MSGLGNKAILAKNLKYYMELSDKTQAELCRLLGINVTTFSEWIRANSYPRIDKIEILANYFGINKSDLIEDKSQVLIVKSGKLYESINELPKEARDELESYVSFLKTKYKR